MFDSALTYARATNDAEGVARAAANVPLVKVELEDFDGARRGFETAFAAARKVGDDRAEGNDPCESRDARYPPRRCHGLAPVASTGPLPTMRRSTTRPENRTRSVSLRRPGAKWVISSTRSLMPTRDLRSARSHGLRQEVAATLEVIADLYAQAGNTSFALQRLLQADSLDAALGLTSRARHESPADSDNPVGNRQPSAAITRLREALSLHKKRRQGAESIYDRLFLATALFSIGDRRAALAEADSAMSDAALVHSEAAVRDAAVVSARLALDAKRSSGVRSPSSELLIRLSAAPTGSRRTCELGPALALGRLDEATSRGELSIARLERERATLGIGLLRSGFLANRSAPYSHLVAIYLARHDTASAFRVAASLPVAAWPSVLAAGPVGAGTSLVRRGG